MELNVFEYMPVYVRDYGRVLLFVWVYPFCSCVHVCSIPSIVCVNVSVCVFIIYNYINVYREDL